MSDEHAIEMRIIDANLNRAREALRVMEEFARFGLDDARLTRESKELRHALRQASSTLDGRALMRREIARDVGREITTDVEFRRADAAAVVEAACKRLSEALRALEEYGKVVDPSFGRRIERIRYTCYETERRILLAVRARTRMALIRLYVLITERFCKKNWLETARDALEGGANCIQLREKDLADRELFRRATKLADLCHQYDALFIVNDRPDVASACGADGVHLGQDDLSVWAARRVLPARSLVGVSTHGVQQAIDAANESPDYVAVGPVFSSTTKPSGAASGKPLGETPKDREAVGARMIAKVRSEISLPLAAIGGITPENAHEIRATGPTILCVCAAVTSCADPKSAAARLVEIAG